MKKWVVLLISCITLVQVEAQNKSIPALDKSSLDISFYPSNYPILKIQDKAKEPLAIRVIYSRPQKNSREVFGGIVEYGQVWRFGANEATEIEFFKDVTIGKVRVKKGRYTLYAIPQPESWTLILNRENDTWGAFKYDSKKDVVRTEVTVLTTSEITDAFTMYFDSSPNGALLNILWDNKKATLPIIF